MRGSARMTEQQRTGATITVGLGTQLIAAALALIAVVGAVSTYVLDKRTPGALFYVLIVLTVLVLILSGVFGGQGIDGVRRGVFDGSVTADVGGRDFFLQTLLILLGIVLFGGAILSMGPAKSDPTLEQVAALSAAVQRQSDTIAQLSARVDDLVGRASGSAANPGG